MMKRNKVLALVAGGVLIGGILFCQFACKQETISAEELKQQFAEKRESLAPVYNLEQEDKLCFQFALDYQYIEDLHVDGLDMISVHTAPTCDRDSKVECYVWEEDNQGKTTVYVSPIMPAYATESLIDTEEIWGCAPIYYACICYDIESDEPKKLDVPMVIPFTVKSSCEVPNVMGLVDEYGQLLLSWEAVEGADSYTIYQCRGDGGWIEKIGDTTDISYLLYEELENSGFQNDGISGSYYVTAHINGKESNLSAPVHTAELPLPQCFLEELAYGKVYASIEQLPDKMQIVNTDQSVMWRPVHYRLADVDGYAYYEFEVAGTMLGGMVCVEVEDQELPAVIESESDFSYLDTNIQLNRVPSMAVKTVLAQNNEGMDNRDDGICFYQLALEQTEQWISEGSATVVSKPVKGCKVFADSAGEAWLCYHLLAAEKEIPLQAFPDLLDPYVLEDTFLKVCHQNPYIMGVQSYYFDYEKLTLNIEYVYTKNEISKRQKQLYKEATEVVSSIINDEMSPEEKTEAIYHWMEEQCTYADEEWDALQEQHMRNEQLWKEFEDVNHAYGAIVNGKALCKGYASAYQLLCYMADVKAITVNGYLNGNIPHAWNMVYVDGKWYQVDCSSNQNTTGIPFYLYYADVKSAEARGYVLGNEFAMRRECDLLYQQNDESGKEYYAANHLEVATVAEIEWLLTKSLDEGQVAFRCVGMDLDENELIEIVRKVYLKHGKEAELEHMNYHRLGGYINIYKK